MVGPRLDRDVVWVCGEASALPTLDTSWVIVRSPAGELFDGGASPALAIFDLRHEDVDAWSRLRAHEAVRDLPLLLLAGTPQPESVLSLLRADDLVVLGVDPSGALRRRAGILLDRARLRIMQSQFELREAERARFERLAAMGTMVAGFAHEVRNPVAAMRSIAEELAEQLRDAGVDTPHVGLMLRMLERIERLVRTSLQFGRPAAPKRSSQRPWLIVQFAIAELRPRLHTLGAQELNLSIEEDLPSVHVDEKQIAQALVVLLNNALDATTEPGRVTVKVGKGRPVDDDGRLPGGAPAPDASIWFEVTDDGPGIAPENIGRIFDPFFTTKPTGTGLGLSIAQQIVSENKGRIEVTSMPGVATTFAIVLPVEDGDAETQSRPPRPNSDHPTTEYPKTRG